MQKITKYILFIFGLSLVYPSWSQTINGSNVPADEISITYWDKDKKKMRSRGKYNYAGFSGIGKQDGKWEYWYENGKLEEVANYTKGKLNGQVVKYWDNGKKMHIGYFKNDIIDSTMTSWYDNGKVREEGTYKLGEKIGLWKYFDLDGKPTHEEKHVDGQIYLISYWNHKHEKTINNGNGKKIEYYSTYETSNIKPRLKEEASYENGLVHGPYVEYSPQSKVIAKGNFKNGKKDGDWEYFFNDGILFKKVSYLENEFHGDFEQYLITDTSYIKSVTGKYDHGKKTGEWEWKFSNGTTDMKGSFENDLQEGYWYFGYNDGTKNYEGNFSKGMQEGEWTYYYPDGELWRKGTYHLNKKDGEWNTWFEKGEQLSQGNYKEDQPDGVWTSWYENSQTKDEGSFKMGVMDGVWKGWYPNGKMSYSGFYVDGFKSGKWSYWFDNGKLLDEGEWKVVERVEELNVTGTLTPKFKESVKHGKWISYNERGEKIAEGSFFEGVKDGKWLFYQQGGLLLANEMNYKKGELHGKTITYNRSGKVESEMNYKENQKDGDAKIYDMKGRVLSHKVYEKDKLKKVVIENGKPVGK